MLAFPLSSQKKISFTLLLLSKIPRLLFVIDVSSGCIPSPVIQTFMKYDFGNIDMIDYSSNGFRQKL